ncbi:TIGR00730 family Rossman fold protein [Aestuariirhabdus litorea]|uniref:Cytokinin riboside 5'-monophosphate phosphoribohydrolase n=1 Tax=Aestuariirhabdus litorea TaxID=2528527 RepID=A0A3P3VN20_9GAMM|nr:TIGR00730 family Rossman fold protein [Aestuariirhabdus litorea]RRJ83099.1 TIGR00730 family Rossman fold protein [Aestuariirhabdus litorea]RWW93256.1 TIGR00730 family Rossman fold protein [Endozoicomonadaceae bacterium GTF-13]
MRVAVFCGSSAGRDTAYAESARTLGRALVTAGHELVYGGGNVGLMGLVADAVIEAGGYSVGVMPRALREREIQHPGLSELHIVADMHERKATMARLADGFVALPGGIGTLEELFEVWTWAQLGYHLKPCALLNAGAYYDGLLGFLSHMVEEGFMGPAYREMLIVEREPAALLEAIATYSPPPGKWG